MLKRSPKTVANQLATVADKYRAFAGLADEVPLSRAELVAHFAPVLDRIEDPCGIDTL